MALRSVLRRAPRMVDRPVEDVMKEIPSTPYLVAVAGSIVGSAALFLSGRRNWGLFIGLWAPTLLNFALMNKLVRHERE